VHGLGISRGRARVEIEQDATLSQGQPRDAP